ncbi:MAG: VOC family protein [Actinocatenispora sp.]
MLRVGTVVLGAADVLRAATFWMQALDYVPRDGPVLPDWTVLVPGDGEPGAAIAIMRSDSPVQERPRVHLDLYAGGATDQAAEVERLTSLGAERVDWNLYPDAADFVVLADTEGNRFCVIDKAAEMAADPIADLVAD